MLDMTAEARHIALERSRASLAANRAAGAHFRRDFLDAVDWEALARARGLRLPQWHHACTPGGMRRWLRKLGITVEDYLSFAGERTLRDFGRKNPDWSLRAWAGVVLDSLCDTPEYEDA